MELDDGLAVERGALQRQDGGWLLADRAVLETLTPETVVLDQRIAVLPVTATRVLRWLAVAGQPLPQRLFGGGTLDSELEAGGFVVASDGQIALGHESIGERLLEHEPATTVRSVQVDLARAILDATTMPLGQLRLAGQLAVKAKSDGLLGIALDRWLMQTPERASDLESAWPAFLGVAMSETEALGG